MEQKCNFLWSNYTNIFNRLMKDELDIGIFRGFIKTLKDIEDGKIDQHEGSFRAGKILKKMYIDSAIKRQEKTDKRLEKSDEKKKVPKTKVKKISWNQFKERKLSKAD